MRIVYLATPVNDIKGWLLLIIVRNNSFFVLTSKLAVWEGNHHSYYIKTNSLLKTKYVVFL